MKLPFAQIDAFADRPFTGNQAGVVLLDRWLDDHVLQAIAEENNVAETAFLVPSNGEADYELRWFTPAVEVALCGHATLASGHYLLGGGEGEQVRFQTRQSGMLEVARAGDGYEVNLPAYPPALRAPTNLTAYIGGAPVETRWHDNGYWLLLYASAAEVIALTPDFAPLRQGEDILYIATAPGETTDVVSRVFAPAAGIDEDSVTGSAHSVLTPYWAERFGRDSFTAYQASRRGGHVACRLDGDRAILGGRCVTVIEGTLTL